MDIAYFNFLQDTPVRVAYAISAHGMALLIVGAMALILASGGPSSEETGDLRRWRWFGWFAMLKGVGVMLSLAMGVNYTDASRVFFEAIYMSATLPAWLAGAKFAWGAWREKPAWAADGLPTIMWLGLVGVSLVLKGWRGLELAHVALAFTVGFAVLGALVRESRALEKHGLGLGAVGLTLVATGITGLLGLECLGWEYYGRFQGWTMNTLPFFIAREFWLMTAGAAFAAVLAAGWWLWMRRHVARVGARGWLKRSLWMVPLAITVTVSAGFMILNRIKIEGGDRADRIFELRLRTVRLGLEMAGFQAAPSGEAFTRALKRQAMINPDLDVIAFARASGGRLETITASSGDFRLPSKPYLWRERAGFDGRFETAREPFSSSFMQDEAGGYALYCEPWPSPGEGWLVMRVSFSNWADTMGPVLVQATFIIALTTALAVTALVYLVQRELGADVRMGAARVEAASRAKSELLARASHELRTPIQGVLGYAELLGRSNLDAAQAEWVAAVRGQGSHLLRLVNDLLDFGALQNGRLSIEEAPFSPRELAREALAAVRPLAEAKRLSCVVETDEATPGRVIGDATRLRQILVNLLGNAVKFTDAGEVRLAMRADLGRRHPRLIFKVSDTGRGMSDEELAWIFDSPRRARRGAGEGAGLGLALARGLCHAMGGDLVAESRAGRGSTFTATVDVRLEGSGGEAAAPDEEEATPRLGLNVLVVEDNTALRHLFAAWLRELGCDVTLASSGEMALAKAGAGAFDTIILDLGLPGIDGREVARRLRKAGPGTRVRIVGLSAHASDADRQSAIDAGMDVFLAKPVDLASLARAIRGDVSSGTVQAEGWLNSALLSGPRAEALRDAARAETPAILEELRRAMESGDAKKVADTAHYLCNTADVLGLAELREACRRCEDAAREGREADMAKEAADIARLGARATA